MYFFLGSASRLEITLSVTLLVAISAFVCINIVDGYFLSDDFVNLNMFEQWTQEGVLLARVAEKFWTGIDGVNGFYRPLTYFSFALDFVIHGKRAGGWLAVNLVLHVVCALLVADITWRLAGDGSRGSLLAAAMAGSLFFVLSPSWEVALWIAARYDALATAFTLLAGALLIRRKRVIDGWTFAAVGATIAALLSKESGSIAFVLVSCLAMAQALAARSPGDRLFFSYVVWARLMLPWFGLLVGYALVRYALFGSPFKVYFAAPDVEIGSWARWTRLFESFVAFARSVFPGLPGLMMLATATVAAAAGGAMLCFLYSRALLVKIAAVLVAMIGSMALLALSVPAFEPAGIGGRLFYGLSSMYCIVVGLSLYASLMAPRNHRCISVLVLGINLFVVVIHIMWGYQAIGTYSQAHQSMRSVTEAIARIVVADRGAKYYVLIVPDALGRVPFGRNAQAGLIAAVVEGKQASSVVLVQTDTGIPTFEFMIREGMIDALRQYPLWDVLGGRVPRQPWTGYWPHFMCWSARSASFIELPVQQITSQSLSDQLQSAILREKCFVPLVNDH